MNFLGTINSHPFPRHRVYLKMERRSAIDHTYISFKVTLTDMFYLKFFMIRFTD